MIKKEDIEKYDTLVKEKFPSARMRAMPDLSDLPMVYWTDRGICVATLSQPKDGLTFQWNTARKKFENHPFEELP